jgi:hypothetical protein
MGVTNKAVIRFRSDKLHPLTHTVLLLSIACAAPGSRSSPGNGEVSDSVPAGRAADQMEISGVIRYYKLEGGFFAIRGDDDQVYNPINLSEEFRQDGLPVVAKVKVRRDRMGIHQVGTLVEVVEIRKR